MLFKRDMEPCCSWCDYGTKISDTEVACLKRGIVSAAGACAKFKYDPLKREPPTPEALMTEGLSQEDFDL